MSDFAVYMEQALKQNGQERFTPKLSAFEGLARLLQQANERMNLTAITDDAGIAYLHVADCLMAEAYLPAGARLADVGCGGGFPTLPLAIARPDLAITAIDSTAKKLGFVSETAAALGLCGVSTLPARAEAVGRGPLRGGFDAVCARAVAALPVLLELCVPLLKCGGRFVALKGKTGGQELAQAKGALSALGCSARMVEYTLQGPSPQARSLIIVTKEEKTAPVYPRDYAKIVKKPL